MHRQHAGRDRAGQGRAGQSGGKARMDADAQHGDTTTLLKHVLAFLGMMLLSETNPLESCNPEPTAAKVNAQSSQVSPAPCHKQTMQAPAQGTHHRT